MDIKILSIETSCDETGVALVRREGDVVDVLSEKVASQVEVHSKTGGIIPNVAAREHAAVIEPIIGEVVEESGVDVSEVDAIAVTVGPGLMPSLSIGVTAARTLAYAWRKPVVPVHHLEGHICSALLGKVEGTSSSKFKISKKETVFPALALVVSGGHTMLVEADDFLRYKILGSTRDDAAGEAFDKVARLLDLGYPGGPAISKAAEAGDDNAFAFTRPMVNSGDLDFSFSGLKTDVLYTLREIEKGEGVVDEETKSNIAVSFQRTVTDSLLVKVGRAVEQVGPKTLLLSGGVAANTVLREEMSSLADEARVDFRVPSLSLCQDNGAMIGMAGVLAFATGRIRDWKDVEAKARVSLEDYSSG